MTGFAGVFGTADPAASLRALGVEPAWADADAAFGGAPAGVGPRGIVAAGDVLLDNAPDLRRRLGMPDAGPHALLAALFAAGGVDACRAARGMLAAALWDPESRSMVLLRDAVGARTLYYARSGGACWFAARARVLPRSPAVSRELSLPALRAYLACAYVPGAMTMRRDVSELRPGSTLALPGGDARQYWRPGEGEWDADAPIERHAERLRALLEDAVRARLPPRGPVGVYLSGGLDSSLVAALAARLAPGPVHTYSIHFGPEHRSELEFSGMVARHCGTRHRVLALPARLIREHLPASLSALDDPIGDPLTVPNYLLGMEAAREVGTVLNGEGGDPCFGGPKNLPMLLQALYEPRAGRAAAYLRSHQKCWDDLRVLLQPEVLAELEREPSLESLVAPYLEDAGTRHYLNRLMRLNVELKGADHILTKVNNLTSVHGVVGRSPLFDPRVVEAAFAIPPRFKLDGAEEKAVLKRAVSDLLPEAILRRPKSGMLVPVQAWMRRDLRRYARRMLLGRDARTRPYLRRDTVSGWLDGRVVPITRLGVKLWLLLTLEVWLRVQEREDGKA